MTATTPGGGGKGKPATAGPDPAGSVTSAPPPQAASAAHDPVPAGEAAAADPAGPIDLLIELDKAVHVLVAAAARGAAYDAVAHEPGAYDDSVQRAVHSARQQVRHAYLALRRAVER